MASAISHVEPEALAAAVKALMAGHAADNSLYERLSATPGFVYGELRNSGRHIISRWASDTNLWKSLGKLVAIVQPQATDANELMLCLATKPRALSSADTNRWQQINANINRGLFGYEFRLADTPNHFHRMAPLAFVAENRTFEKFLQTFAEQHSLTFDQAKAGAVIVREFDSEQFHIKLRPEMSAQRLFRGSPLVPQTHITQDSVQELARLLSEYLVRSVQPDGRMTYRYFPSRGSEDRTGNNSVRQWMATRALAATWRRSHNDSLAQVIRRNIDYNLQAMYRNEGHLGLIVEGDKIKLGAMALAAMALSESPFAKEYATQHDRLSTTVRSLWMESGQFRTFYGTSGRMDNQNFYPGEALLFWTQRIADGDTSLVELFWKSFEFYQRWHLADRNPAFIPWHTQAYWNMWKLTSDERLSHAIFEMNDWLLDIQQWETAPYPDCHGRFYDPHRPFGPPHASSTGVFLEGLVDAYALAKRLNDELRADRYRTLILRGLRSIAQLTFKNDSDMFYVSQRDRLRGGVRTCEYDNAVRVDNVQHCLMAIYKVLDAFSAEDFTKPHVRIAPSAPAETRVSSIPDLAPRANGPLWTARELATITQAHWYGSMPDVNGVAYLPRRVKPGDLFVALNYDEIDHHNNVSDALTRGAAAALVSRRPPGVPTDAPLLLTANMHEALMRMARAARGRAQGKFIGITGRAGKTFTKDTLSYLLAKQATTLRTEGNDNDGTGVAITLARGGPDCVYNVIEISMAAHGDIANSVRPKAKTTRPHVAIITRVSVGQFDDDRYREHHRDVAVTKAQIFEGLEPGGTAIINRDDEDVFEYLRQQARACNIEYIHTFGQHPDAEIRLLETRRCKAGYEVSFRLHGKHLAFTVGVNAAHWIPNTLAVLGAVDAVGANVEEALVSMPEIHESPGRGNRYVFPVGSGTALLLDYSRNSTIHAVHASLELLAEHSLDPGGRRIVVLGDMGALESNPDLFHRDLAGLIEQRGVDLVFAVGEHMKHMYDALTPSKRGGFAEDTDQLAPAVKAAVKPGDVLLAQGKRPHRLNRVVQVLVGESNYIPWE